MKRSPSPVLRLGSVAIVLVTATMFFGAGCGAAPAPNAGFGDTTLAGVSPREASPPQNLNEAEAQLALAERNVFGAFGQNKLEPQGQFAQPPGQTAQGALPSATSPASPPPPPTGDAVSSFRKDSETQANDAKPEAGAAQTAPHLDGVSSSPCETACRALASMSRSADHICLLAGDSSDHCTNARERVRAASERVRQSCSDCAG
jgi:hypothetical protein